MTGKNGKYRLGEVATVRSGLVLSRKQARTAGGVRYRALTLRSIEPDGSVDMGALDDYFAVGALPPDHLSQAGDVIVRLTSPYTAVLVDGDTAGLVVSSNFVMVRIHSFLLIPGYLFWLLNTPRARRAVSANAGSNILGAVNPRYFAGMELSLPSPERQRTIAGLNALARKETALLRRLAAEKKQYCDSVLDALQNGYRKGFPP